MEKSKQNIKDQKSIWQRRGVMSLMTDEARSDVLGSYTGTPKDPDDIVPTQDADDL